MGGHNARKRMRRSNSGSFDHPIGGRRRCRQPAWMRFLLVDRIRELESGKRAVGVKNVTLSEDFFTHHFPYHPIMPGALIMECLVQLADWMLRESTAFESVAMPSTVDSLKFYKLVRPGDQLKLAAAGRAAAGKITAM